MAMDTPLIEQVIKHMQSLPYESQRRVLEFARALALSTPRGVPGHTLLRFAGSISADDVERIRKAIEQGCEQVNANEW